MKRVKAQEVTTYQCECPYCGETVYSDLNDNWDEQEMFHYDQSIRCDECDKEFFVGT